jgi:membrane protease YdiL (CAAX protease family)
MTVPPDPAPSMQAEERGAALALLPIAATLAYYALPEWVQAQRLVQFVPQLIAYLGLALWAWRNTAIATRVGLQRSQWSAGVKLGVVMGLLLGGFNAFVVLHLVPFLGWDITFLKHTPHARVPVLMMVPWFIMGIALLVELNFRGFVLGRLAALEATLWSIEPLRRLPPLALVTSALVFAFDPFMVVTFRHLHWIAVWDGLIWGFFWLLTRNLYVPIVAHAVEVIVVYSAVRSVLMS